ncbi:MAG: hypothetical protein J5819_00370 [Eubacterium sp.]|nr:hypothetical protein [Eubacterium sp.]
MMKNKRSIRRVGRKHVAVVVAAALTLAMTPVTMASAKVELKDGGEIYVSAAKDEIVNETRNEDIVAQKYGLYIENNGGSIDYTLNGNVDAAKVGLAAGNYYDAIRINGVANVKAGDVTATEGRAMYAQFSGGKITLGNLKSKQGISAMCIGKDNTLELTAGNMESEGMNVLTNTWYGSGEGGNVTANFGDITTKDSALSLTSSYGGTMTVKTGKLTATDGSGLSITGSSGGKAVVTVGEIDATGPYYGANVIYSSGGQADIDVTVNGNAASRATGLSLGDGGVYKIYGDVSTTEGDGIRAGLTYNDTDVLITGTLNAAANGINNGSEEKNKFTLTLWKLKWGEKSNAVVGDDENETKSKAINYIVKTTQPANGTFKVVKADGASALDTKTYKHGDKDEVFEVAHQGERLFLKSDAKILKAYNGSGANKVELPKDAAGNYYIDVVKGGGIELSADLEGGTVSPTASPTPTASPAPTGEPTPTATPAPTKKPNPVTITTRRIYGKEKHTVTIPRDRAFTIKNAKGKLTFSKIKGNKKITINKNGDIRIEQHLTKKHNYFLGVRIKVAGNDVYKPKTIEVEVRIKIH